MAAVDDLKAVVTELQATSASLATEVAALKASGTGVSDADVEAAVTALQSVETALKALLATPAVSPVVAAPTGQPSAGIPVSPSTTGQQAPA